MRNTKTIYINDNECRWIKDEIWIYKDQYLTFIKELDDGSDEMAYCDVNGNIIPNTPIVICLPELTDARCIRGIE